MHIPHPLPPRIIDLSTDDPSMLAAAQPERGREYVQILPGEFRGALKERLHGSVGLLREAWSCSLRVRCARPRSYVAFSSVTSEAPAAWCGLQLDADAVIEVDRDWELTSRGAVDSHSFAIETKSLERIEAILDNGEGSQPVGNRVLRGPGFGAAARTLRRYVAKALEAGALPPEARRAMESDLAHLAARLRGWGDPAAKPESASRRRAAVRRIEEYLAAQPRALPSLAGLCELAGVSERTLEYAFREHVGLPPQRYLRMRRLNGVRRDLRDGDPGSLRVTEVAMRWGFWELGRFAREYRALFGERPSETLARRRVTRSELVTAY